jgi:hypothetical protein
MLKTVFSACLAVAIVMPTMSLAAAGVADSDVAQRIGSQLKESGQLRDYRIGVKYQDGVAWLSGTVANEQQLSTAMRLTQQMRGVDHVVNNLAVSGSSPTVASRSLELGQSLEQAGQRSRQLQSATARQRPQQHSTKQTNRQASARQPVRPAGRNNMPRPMGAMPVRQAMAESYGPMPAQYSAGAMAPMGGSGQGPMPAGYVPGGQARAVNYDNAQMPGYAWPSYASYPNYAALTYPQQYSPTAWPYIGPFYPYPQVPLGWRKVALEWDDGWWFLDFSDVGSNH